MVNTGCIGWWWYIAFNEDHYSFFTKYQIFIFVDCPVKKLPGLEKHGCHAMILSWSYHDHGETYSWSCHNDGMAAMFLGMVVMIHGMIMLWSSWFLCFFILSKKLRPYAILWHTWLSLEGFTPPNWRVGKIKGRLLQTDLEFSSVITKQQLFSGSFWWVRLAYSILNSNGIPPAD